MENKTDQLLKIMNIIAWIVFVGLLIKTGSLIISYFMSIENKEMSSNLFGGINLLTYRNLSFTQYTFIVSYKAALFGTEAYIAFLVAKLLGKLDLKKPFSSEIHGLMKNISYGILNLWIVAILHNTHVRYLAKKNGFHMDLFSSDFIFLAGVIFIFAQILKRGIEIQSENDLTI